MAHWNLHYEYPAEMMGAKAKGIARMWNLNLPVPEGFVYPTDYTFETPPTFREEVGSHVRLLADRTKRRWNNPQKPLTVSVRSGAPVSMPGMMDTILNVGMNRDLIDGLTEHMQADNKAFALDCYRRLIQMFGTCVDAIDKSAFDEYYSAARIFYQDQLYSNERACEVLVDKFEMVYERETGRCFPQNPTTQLYDAVMAVFGSWANPAAHSYREANGIPHHLGTAVIVQEMVYGNCNTQSGTGVVFTHNPNTGTKGAYGEFIVQAQGEDVVAGTHATTGIDKLFESKDFGEAPRDLRKALSKLYNNFGDMLDIEFTIQNGELYLLQCRPAKRSRRATVHYVMDLVRNGTMSIDDGTAQIIELLPSVETMRLDGDLLHLVRGVPVCGAKVAAPIAIGSAAAAEYMAQGKPFIFVTHETSPSDHVEMAASVGILTAAGGTLSHAAVIARSWDKTCVVGADIKVSTGDGYVIIDQLKLVNGDVIQIDGETGDVYRPQ